MEEIENQPHKIFVLLLRSEHRSSTIPSFTTLHIHTVSKHTHNTQPYTLYARGLSNWSVAAAADAAPVHVYA